MELPRVYIGYDTADHTAYLVARESLRRWHPGIEIEPLVDWKLRARGLLRRPYLVAQNGQTICGIDAKPFSTAFTYSRFLVPHLNDYKGWALFVDADVMFCRKLDDMLADVDDSKWIYCVQHKHEPTTDDKVIGTEKEQTRYFRKNWSSVVLWNCAVQPRNMVELANTKPGGWLHRFGWVDDSSIGELDRRWNYLVGEQAPPLDCGIAHFTVGTPDFVNYDNGNDSALATEWWEYARRVGGRI